MKPTTITRYNPSEVPAELGLDGCDFDGIRALINCVWVDRWGYYFEHNDGTFSCLVFNESEVFDAEDAARAWLFDNVERLSA